jgi:hypothetical protein
MLAKEVLSRKEVQQRKRKFLVVKTSEGIIAGQNYEVIE